MKKIVIAMLLMLPLIIVATVLLSANIISVNVYIAVQKVELNTDDILILPLSQGQYQFKATVYPTGARNKNVFYEIENYESFTDDQGVSATIDQNGLVKFNSYCAFDVLVTTEEGYKTARCNVIVESGEVESVDIVLDSYNVEVGESVSILPTFNPIDGQADNLTWSSSNPAILRVDRNGIITGVSQGTADITVFVKDDISATKTFTVTKGVTTFGQEFKVSRNFTISEIAPSDEILVQSGGHIEGDNFIFDDDVAVLSIGGQRVVITKCQPNDIEFEHSDILRQKLVKLNSAPMYLNVVYSDVFNSSKVEATYSTNNELVATISANGKINAVGRGKVQLTASAQGKTITINFEVVQELKYIRLNTTDGDDKKGIADSAVYGNMSYVNGKFVPYVLDLGISYPVEYDWQDFEISVSDENIAYVDGHSIVFKNAVKGEKSLQIIVKAKHSAYKSMEVAARRNLTIANAVNCSDYQSMYAAGQAGLSICMLNNIELAKTDNVLKIKGNLYGNGYELSALNKELGQEEPLVTVNADNVKVSNIKIRCDDVVKMNQANGCSGVALLIGEKHQSQRFNKIEVEFCILGDSFFGLEMHNSDVYVNGCIIRNTSNFGISLPSGQNPNIADKCDYSNLHINNSVMSNIVATAVGIATGENAIGGGTLPKQSNFYSTGFLDIYNWQDITSARMLDRPLFENPAFDELVKRMLNNTLGNEVKKPIYDDIRYEMNGKSYIHLGIVTAGALYESTSKVEIEDPRIIKFDIEALDGVAKIAKTFKFDFYPCVLYIYENTSDIAAETEFYENKWSYRRLRGEKSI
ncbi:MAG: hypothetical protein GX242_04095 [Clostridiales bacterium]|nr:hypothetical protein [Clostridiales bacterium]